MYKLKMSVRSLFYRKKQYIPLITVCAVGIAISILCIFVINGMIASLQHKAKIYYGGDYMIWGGQGSVSMDNADEIIEKIRPAFPPNTLIVPRFDYSAWDTSLYFEGVSAIPRVIKGIDFETEKELMSSLKVISGDIEKMPGSNGILISALIANNLNIKVGDELLLMIRTEEGYIDTITFTLHGILQDSSVFGALTTYADLNFLLNSFGKKPNWANRICIQLPARYDSEKIANQIQSRLEKIINMAPLPANKDILEEYIYSPLTEEPIYGLIRLSTNLEDVQILINAMRAISLFIIAMLMLIIAAGVSSAFRVIVMKRINEIGIYMAIGMRRFEIAVLILCETFILILFGCIAGLFLSLILCQIISNINLSFIPGMDIFLINGVILTRFSIKYFALIAITVSVTTLLAVLFSIRKSVRATPVEALGITE